MRWFGCSPISGRPSAGAWHEWGSREGRGRVRDLREWMAEEEPFLADQKPWERADLIVAGTPQIPFDPLTELVVAQPPSETAKA